MIGSASVSSTVTTGVIFGGPADLLRHHIEVRGLGVLNIKDLFGVTSVNERKRIDVVVRLSEWNDRDEYDRLGVGDQVHVILGHGIRLLTVPVRPGRDMGSILEIAARNELLRRAGKDSARSFIERVEASLRHHPDVERPVEPESMASPVDTIFAPGPPSPAPARRDSPPGWRTGIGGSSATESSAWIPAVRPKKEEG